MNVRHPFVLALLCLGLLHQAPAQEEMGRIFFHNGDALAGRLVGLDTETGRLLWAYPGSATPFHFHLKAVSHVLPPPADTTVSHSQPLFRLTLTNGDTLIGAIQKLDQSSLTLDAGLRIPLTIPRKHLHRLDTSLGASQLLYRGPNEPGEWKIGYRGKNWRFDSGRLIAENYSSTGRVLDIPKRARIEFDVSLRDHPTLNAFLCADNPHNGGDSYYYLQLTPNYINFRRYWRDHPRTYINLIKEPEGGKAFFPGQSHVHLAVEIDRESRRLRLFLNGKPYASYRDPAPEPPGGSSVILTTYGNGSLRLQDIRLYALQPAPNFPKAIAAGTTVLRDGRSWTGPLTISPNSIMVGGAKATLDQLFAAGLSDGEPPSKASTPIGLYLASGGRLGCEAKIRGDELQLGHPLLGKLTLPLRMVLGLILEGEPAENPTASLGRVLFKNGDQLAGTLEAWTGDTGLAWKSAHGPATLTFPPRTPAEILLPHQRELPPASAVLHLTSGDTLPGELSSITRDQAILETAFSQPIHIPLPVIRRMKFEEPSTLHYRGPGTSLAHWKATGQDAPWHLDDDGVLIGRGPGSLGRAIPMPERGRIDVEMSWVGQLDTSLTIFARDLTRPVQPKTYRLHCENERISLYRGLSDDEVAPDRDANDPLRNRRLPEQLERFGAQFGGGASRRLGSPVSISYNTYKRSRILTLCWDQTRGTLALLVGGKLASTWKDPDNLIPPASGLILHHHNRATVLKVLALEVRSWNGILPDPPLDHRSAKALTKALVRLRNQDELLGHSPNLSAPTAALSFDSELGPLALPLDRLDFIQFPPTKYPIAHRPGMVVDAHLLPNGNCRFFLSKIHDGELHVSSPYYGQNLFRLSAFRKLLFDLQDRPFWDRKTTSWPHPIPIPMRPILQARQLTPAD